MTGFAEHCAVPPAEVEATTTAGSPAVPRLLAAKAVSNLFFLAGHPALSASLRSMLWHLRGHWQALEHRAASRSAEALRAAGSRSPAASLVAAAEPWTGDEPAPVWH